MASLKTKFSVGLFLIIGIAVTIAGIIWLGVSNYFEKGKYYCAYFDESVQGLDKDSPVKYRGVSIGRVHKIDVAPDERLIETILKIESDIEPQKQTQGIVAQLKSVGITGLMFIELERKDPGERDLSPSITFDPPYPVIPTRPSEISKIFQGIEDVINVLRGIDTKAISDRTVQALDKINTAIDDVQLAAIAADLRKTIKGVQQLVRTDKVERLVASIEKTSGSLDSMAVNADNGITEIRGTVADLDRVINTGGDQMQTITADLKSSAEQLRRAMESAAVLMNNTDRNMDALQRQLLATLYRIDQAGQNLNRFLDRVSAQPSQLIFGGPSQAKPAAP